MNQQEEQMMICPRHDNCSDPDSICNSRSKHVLDIGCDATKPGCPACVPAEQADELPVQLSPDEIRAVLEKEGWEYTLNTACCFVAETKRLRNELAKAQKEFKTLRSRRDHWRRTADVNREMWLNRHDELQAAKDALAQTSLTGIYTEFDGLADAIQQMACYALEQERLAFEFIGAFSDVADIVGAPEMWPLDGLHLVTDKVREIIEHALDLKTVTHNYLAGHSRKPQYAASVGIHKCVCDNCRDARRIIEDFEKLMETNKKEKSDV